MQEDPTTILPPYWNFQRNKNMVGNFGNSLEFLAKKITIQFKYERIKTCAAVTVALVKEQNCEDWLPCLYVGTERTTTAVT
jgi:hypothetical protein